MTKNKYLFPFIALTSLFFLWGFLTVLVDFLIPRLKEIFTLTYFQAGLVQFAFFMAYFFLSIPSGTNHSNISLDFRRWVEKPMISGHFVEKN